MSLDPIPPEARPYQDRPAGLVSRACAGLVDAIMVLGMVVAGHLAVNGVAFLISPRSFHFLSLPAPLSRTVSLGVLTLYLFLAWSVTGRTYGCRVLGLRVIANVGGPIHPLVALVRAILCVVFPIGLAASAFGRRRSLQDLLLRTAVVYDWRVTRKR